MENIKIIWEAGNFCINNGKVFNGITTGSTWNGWETPWFTLPEIKAIREWVEDGINQNPISIENKQVSVFYDVGEDSTHCETVQHEGETYYFIDGWCWDKTI